MDRLPVHKLSSCNQAIYGNWGDTNININKIIKLTIYFNFDCKNNNENTNKWIELLKIYCDALDKVVNF